MWQPPQGYALFATAYGNHEMKPFNGQAVSFSSLLSPTLYFFFALGPHPAPSPYHSLPLRAALLFLFLFISRICSPTLLSPPTPLPPGASSRPGPAAASTLTRQLPPATPMVRDPGLPSLSLSGCWVLFRGTASPRFHVFPFLYVFLPPIFLQVGKPPRASAMSGSLTITPRPSARSLSSSSIPTCPLCRAPPSTPGSRPPLPPSAARRPLGSSSHSMSPCITRCARVGRKWGEPRGGRGGGWWVFSWVRRCKA